MVSSIEPVRVGGSASMWSKPFLVLYASQFVAAMGISMVSPLLPVYAEELGASGVWIGLTFSIFAVTQMVTSPFVGGWSDHLGRKPFIVGGLLLYFVAAIGYLMATELWHVVAFRALSGVGTSMIFSVARAYLGVMMPRGQEGRWSGVFTTADIVGFGIGPVLAGATREIFGFDAVFAGMALLMGSGAVIVSVLLPRRPGESASRDDTEEPQSTIGVAIRDRMVFALTLNWGLVSLSFGSTLAFLGVRLERLGVSPALIGVLFALQSLSSGLSQPFFGRLADRVERRLLNGVGLFSLAVLIASLGLTAQTTAVAAIMVGVGAASGLAAVATNAMQVEAGRRHGMGTVIGLGSAGNAAGVLLGSLLGGVVVDLSGKDAAAFLTAGAMMVIGLSTFVWLTRGMPQTSTAADGPAEVLAPVTTGLYRVVSEVLVPGEPNSGGESTRAVRVEQRAAEREIHLGAQDAGVRIAGLTEVGEFETSFAGSKDAPVDIGRRVTVTVRVGEDGTLLPRRADSDTSSPAATSILRVEVTPSVEFGSSGDAQVVWNGYASQTDLATGRVIATSLSGPTADQQAALQGDRPAAVYGNDPDYKDGLLAHMAGSRAEAVTQALSPLVSGGKMNVGRLELDAAVEPQVIADPVTSSETTEPEAAAAPTETSEPAVPVATPEPERAVEPAVEPRTDFGTWAKRGAALVAAAGVIAGGTFLLARDDSPPVDESGGDATAQSATPLPDSAQTTEPATPPASGEANPNGWDEVDDHGDSGLPPDPGGAGADIRQYDYASGSHVFTMTVQGDGEAMSTADSTKWYNPRFIVNYDPDTYLFDDESGFMLDVRWGPDGALDASAFDSEQNIIKDAVVDTTWLDSSTLRVTVEIPGTPAVVTRTRVELSVRTQDAAGNTVSTFGDDAFWEATP